VRSKAQDTGVCRGEGRQRSTAVGSHPKFPTDLSRQIEIRRGPLISAPSRSFADRDLKSRDDSSPDPRDARSRFNQGPLDQEDTWRKIIISLTGKSKEQRDAKS
jgi:hypothetical protein